MTKIMNKLVVVSGGSKGIGMAIVEKFIQNGFDAAICARNMADLEKLKFDLNEKYPKASIEIFVANLAEKADCEAFGRFVKNLNRPIEVLVNNTGTYEPGQIYSEADGALEKMLNTNLYSAYHLTRSIIGKMIETKKGHIFNICSIASIVPYANGGSYSISKYALYGMTKNLREEMKPLGIRVTAVLPGATHTSSWGDFADSLPPNRLMKPADVAEMAFATYSLSGSSVVEDIVIRPQLGDL
jgi:short-subunit dehydrogenase